MNCPNVMVVKAPSGMGAPTGRTDCVLRLKIPGMVLVKALAASVLRPSPGGPMEAPSRKCCQMGWVSQYRPPPARMTVLPLLPGDQAKPTWGEKSNLLDCVAPSPVATVWLCTIGARYCGSGRLE